MVQFDSNSLKKQKRGGKFSGFHLWQFRLCYLRRVFLVRAFNATVHKVTATIAAATEMRAALLNSGIVGMEEAVTVEVAEGDEVGLAVADVTEPSDITETVFSPALATNISPLLESSLNPKGPFPTVTVATAALVLSDITETVPSTVLVTNWPCLNRKLRLLVCFLQLCLQPQH